MKAMKMDAGVLIALGAGIGAAAGVAIHHLAIGVGFGAALGAVMSRLKWARR